MSDWHESDGDEWKEEELPDVDDLRRWVFGDTPRLLGMFILDENNSPILADSTLAWGRWLEEAGEKRRVACDIIGRYEVSTVFLALDHNWSMRGWPILFETMVFRLAEDGDRDLNAHEGDEFDRTMVRYPTWQEAEKGHARMCETIRNATAGKP